MNIDTNLIWNIIIALFLYQGVIKSAKLILSSLIKLMFKNKEPEKVRKTFKEKLDDKLNEKTPNIIKCPICGSDDCFAFTLQHMKCRKCNNRFTD